MRVRDKETRNQRARKRAEVLGILAVGLLLTVIFALGMTVGMEVAL